MDAGTAAIVSGPVGAFVGVFAARYFAREDKAVVDWRKDVVKRLDDMALDIKELRKKDQDRSEDLTVVKFALKVFHPELRDNERSDVWRT